MKKFASALLTLLVIASLCVSALAASVRTTGDVWLRKGPGKNYSKITAIDSGTKLEYLGDISTDYRGVDWYHVKYHGKKGWVSSRYSKLSGSSSSSSTKKSSTTKKPSATKKPAATEVPEATPAPEEIIENTPLVESTEGATVETTGEPALEAAATDSANTQPVIPPTFGAPQPVELSAWYLKGLADTAAALSLTNHRLEENTDFPETYSNETLLIGGDTITKHFRITGEGYAVYGVSVGLDMDTAIATLTAAGLARADNILGASFQHYADVDAPVNVNGFDSFINIIADASGKVSEISWSVYSGEWASTGAN